MKGKVSFVINAFLKSLIMFDLGMSVTTDGDWIFNNRITGKKVMIKKDDIISTYEEIEKEVDNE